VARKPKKEEAMLNFLFGVLFGGLLVYAILVGILKYKKFVETPKA
jgi:hypothetical protein